MARNTCLLRQRVDGPSRTQPGPTRTLLGLIRTLLGPTRTLLGPTRTLFGPTLTNRMPHTGKRIDSDGNAYTKQEFIDFHGGTSQFGRTRSGPTRTWMSLNRTLGLRCPSRPVPVVQGSVRDGSDSDVPPSVATAQEVRDDESRQQSRQQRTHKKAVDSKHQTRSGAVPACAAGPVHSSREEKEQDPGNDECVVVLTLPLFIADQLMQKHLDAATMILTRCTKFIAEKDANARRCVGMRLFRVNKKLVQRFNDIPFRESEDGTFEECSASQQLGDPSRNSQRDSPRRSPRDSPQKGGTMRLYFEPPQLSEARRSSELPQPMRICDETVVTPPDAALHAPQADARALDKRLSATALTRLPEEEHLAIPGASLARSLAGKAASGRRGARQVW
eukprot:gene17961-biopygen4729